ncbi:glycerophosphodiester phosphodiesterase domain-containing protein 4 [Pseudonaja textilis]|uniref:glycerophosphodiester phosphodiesterase domain-containing protein 4 n=1 Tax=Pseudonaja textilis TaxID=8673 RepID=UPI000EA996EE|nr:glycerophosphodiester phosphodiesterase domain-containing protein 4 [Pseudonaja textilis]
MDHLPIENHPTQIKKSKLRKFKKAKKRLIKICKYEAFVSCLVGLYTCQWQNQNLKTIKPGLWCCNKGECMYFSLLAFTFSFSFVFLYMWGEARNDYNSFDWYSFINLGYWFHWSTFLLFLAVFVFSYLFFLIFIAVLLLFESKELEMHWFHKRVTLFTLFLSVTGLTAITMFWTRQWHTFYLSFQVTAPFLHVIAIFTMVLLAWPVALHFFRVRDKVLQMLILTPYLVVLVYLIFVPLGMYSPCIREKGTLGPKPALIGHRGAPMVAPENTRMSFAKTIDHGAIGLETDVTISYDGVPFLMHDHSLTRTTDIERLYPQLRGEDPAYFTWDILEKLNAGEWFLKNKPFYHMPPFSAEDEELAKSQTIFKLSEFLTLADKANKLVLFDLYRPPRFHPYRNSWISRTLEVLQEESKIKPHLVLWLDNRNRGFVQYKAPQFQHISSSAQTIEYLQRWKIGKLNLDYRRLATVDIRKYAKANITTNLWVVSEPWLYSLAWCYGAESVTTDAVHILGNVSQPFFFLTPQKYKAIWVTTDLLALFFIPLVFLAHW